MLAELRIKNFAIIDSITMTFQKGLTVLTGETGAGKSILVDAVDILLGAKADPAVVRTGEDEALIEALITIESGERVLDLLAARGIRGDELVLKRIISRSGKSRAYINGGLATVTLLSEIGDALVDIHGQHEHQTLLRQDTHLGIVDQAGELLDVRGEVSAQAGAFIAAAQELHALKEKEKHRAEREDLLKYQVNEIAGADLKDREEEHLQSERQILVNAEKLHSLAADAHEILYSQEGSVVEKVSSALKNLRELREIDPDCSALHESLSTALVHAEEVGLALRDYSGKISFDPGRIENIEARLDLIRRLMKKYGGTVDKVRKHQEAAEKELKDMETNSERIAQCEKLLADAGQAYLSMAKMLSEKRAEAARNIALKVEKELSSLGMKKTTFTVNISRQPASPSGYDVQGVPVTPEGMDRVEFLISPNVGEEPKPLSKIASGGELSRIMLALKTVLSGRQSGRKSTSVPGGVPILIFDEVDSGIGGATAEVVGRKLKEVSHVHQVLCVTHLPQIAVFADAHFKVTKGVVERRTNARATKLSEDERVEEVSRMLAGMTITEKTRAHAKEMLTGAMR